MSRRAAAAAASGSLAANAPAWAAAVAALLRIDTSLTIVRALVRARSAAGLAAAAALDALAETVLTTLADTVRSLSTDTEAVMVLTIGLRLPPVAVGGSQAEMGVLRPPDDSDSRRLDGLPPTEDEPRPAGGVVARRLGTLPRRTDGSATEKRDFGLALGESARAMSSHVSSSFTSAASTSGAGTAATLEL